MCHAQGTIVFFDIGNELMEKSGSSIFCEEGIMTRERIAVLFFVLFAITGPAFGIDRLVPSVYLTIQDAIDAADAATNDVVIVADRTYVGTGNYNIDFGGKAITVRSENGPAGCIIDCGTLGRAFVFQTAETAASVVEGFTITNGVVPTYGGAIECYGASPTISNCVITGNGASDGGGIDCMAGLRRLQIVCSSTTVPPTSVAPFRAMNPLRI